MNRHNQESIKSKCKKLGLEKKYSAIVSRMRIKGLTFEEAISDTYFYKCSLYKGVPYTQYCKEHNISLSMIQHRLAAGLPLELAIELPNAGKRGHKKEYSLQRLKEEYDNNKNE